MLIWELTDIEEVCMYLHPPFLLKHVQKLYQHSFMVGNLFFNF